MVFNLEDKSQAFGKVSNEASVNVHLDPQLLIRPGGFWVQGFGFRSFGFRGLGLKGFEPRVGSGLQEIFRNSFPSLNLSKP